MAIDPAPLTPPRRLLALLGGTEPSYVRRNGKDVYLPGDPIYEALHGEDSKFDHRDHDYLSKMFSGCHSTEFFSVLREDHHIFGRCREVGTDFERCFVSTCLNYLRDDMSKWPTDVHRESTGDIVILRRGKVLATLSRLELHKPDPRICDRVLNVLQSPGVSGMDELALLLRSIKGLEHLRIRPSSRPCAHVCYPSIRRYLAILDKVLSDLGKHTTPDEAGRLLLAATGMSSLQSLEHHESLTRPLISPTHFVVVYDDLSDRAECFNVLEAHELIALVAQQCTSDPGLAASLVMESHRPDPVFFTSRSTSGTHDHHLRSGLHDTCGGCTVPIHISSLLQQLLSNTIPMSRFIAALHRKFVGRSAPTRRTDAQRLPWHWRPASPMPPTPLGIRRA